MAGTIIDKYTQSQKNRNIFEVAFLLEKSVYPWICRFHMTPGHMTLTLDPRKNNPRLLNLTPGYLEKCDEEKVIFFWWRVFDEVMSL